MTIDAETKALIYTLATFQGLSFRKVAKECNVSKTTVSRIANKKRVEKKSGPDLRGRPRKLSERERRNLKRALLYLREVEGNFSIKRLMHQAGIHHVSESTVSRFLHSEGYFYLQARKKGLISEDDIRLRLAFAKRILKEKPRDFWTRRIAFYLDGTSFAYKRNPMDQARAPKGRIWRKKSEGLTRGCTAKGRKEGSGGKVLKLMVAISHGKGVIICEPYEKMNGTYFARFIEENFGRMFRAANKGRSRVWLQDGDPSQNCALAKAAMKRSNSELLNIPPRSPDLNPIENLFHILSKKLKENAISRRITHETFEEFKNRVIATLYSIDVSTIDNIIASMNRRIKEVIKSGGKRIKY